MFSSVGWALSDMADAVVVGQKLGATGLAAISLILPVYMFNRMMAHGFRARRFCAVFNTFEQRKGSRGKPSLFSSAGAVDGVQIVTATLGILFLTSRLRFWNYIFRRKLFWATKDYLFILVLSTPLFYLSNILNYFLRNDSCQRRAGLVPSSAISRILA